MGRQPGVRAGRDRGFVVNWIRRQEATETWGWSRICIFDVGFGKDEHTFNDRQESESQLFDLCIS